MVKPIINFNGVQSPLRFQDYVDYLPTAYDDSLTLIQKVNKVIRRMNQIGELTNDLVEKWNQVMEWIINEGLTDVVGDKLIEWVNFRNGTF